MTDAEKQIESLQKLRALHISDTCNGYRLSVALTEGINALEKQMPKKVLRKPDINYCYEEIKCPSCGSIDLREDFPCKCGQILDWKRSEE